MSGRGHRASLPEGGHARPEYLVEDGQGGLVVRHHDRHGQVREYGLASLPVSAKMQRSLAAVFAGRCTPARWASHSTSQTEWRYVQRFARFLAGQQRTPQDLGELTVRLVQEWRETVLREGDYHAFTRITSLLRDDPRLQAGPVADELARRRKAVRGKGWRAWRPGWPGLSTHYPPPGCTRRRVAGGTRIPTRGQRSRS